MSSDVTTLTTYRSPLLDLPGAVAGSGVDAGTAWHYGDPLREQRHLLEGAGLLDRSDRGVLTVAGVDRLSWLHSICSQHVSALADGASAQALILSPNGHVEQDWRMTELDGRVWIDVEPGAAPDASAYLNKMIFMRRVEPVDVSADWAILTLAGPSAATVLAAAGFVAPAAGIALPRATGIALPRAAGIALPRETGGFVRAGTDDSFDLIVPRAELATVARALIDAGAAPVGSWAAAAIRVERHEPRLHFETDHRTIPHEIGLIGVAVHLDKGCYRGQETVARVQNLGRPPRRLVLLHLSGEREELPEPGAPVELAGRSIGFLGTAVHHHELGPVALAVIKRTTSDDAELTVAGMSAAIDPAPTPA